MSWPRFTCPRSQLVVDFRDGVFRRHEGKLIKVGRKLTWINMTTANEHRATGFTGACKSAMGIVDMSAGRLGTDPSVSEYQSFHYFGAPDANWRMAGPLAHFSKKVRAPDLYITVAAWVGATPSSGWKSGQEVRHEEASAHETRTVVAGTNAVAIDTWCVRNLLMPIAGKKRRHYNLDDPNAKVVKFLRYYRQIAESGTLDESLITVV